MEKGQGLLQPHSPSILWCEQTEKVNVIVVIYLEIFNEIAVFRFESMPFQKRSLEEEIDFLEHRLSSLGSPVVFAHNDLLLGNVIYTKEENKVSFIDFEYAAPNHQAYDIGNHFNEFPGKETKHYGKRPHQTVNVVLQV